MFRLQSIPDRHLTHGALRAHASSLSLKRVSSISESFQPHHYHTLLIELSLKLGVTCWSQVFLKVSELSGNSCLSTPWLPYPVHPFFLVFPPSFSFFAIVSRPFSLPALYPAISFPLPSSLPLVFPLFPFPSCQCVIGSISRWVPRGLITVNHPQLQQPNKENTPISR